MDALSGYNVRGLKSPDFRSVINSLDKINMKVVKKHIRDGMKMATDYTEEPYYDKADVYVTRGEYKQGTNKFHTFAMISVVGKDKRNG
ncbi:MAG: hypothetical protein ACP5GS_05570 [Nitrososphaeria archaeon]